MAEAISTHFCIAQRIQLRTKPSAFRDRTVKKLHAPSLARTTSSLAHEEFVHRINLNGEEFELDRLML